MPEVAAPAAAKPEIPPSRLVVTSENRAEFMDKRMDLAKPAAAPVAAEPAKPAPAAEPAKTAASEPPKAAPTEEVAKLEAEEAKPETPPARKQAIRERLSELTEQKKTAQAETAKERERAEKAERELADLRAKQVVAPPAAEEPKAPNRADFATDEAYEDARIDYRADQRLVARDKANAEAQAKAQGERVVATYNERLAVVKAEIPDYEARIAPVAELRIPPYIADSIYESEVGPRLPLYFGDHPEEAKRIIALPPLAALREIGKIEAMLEDTKPAKPAAAPAKPAVQPAVAVSQAPPPISPLKPSNSAEPEAKVDAQGRWTGTFAEYKAARKAGKI